MDEIPENTPDLVRGDDAWIGQAVVKEFIGHGKFRGQVTDVDEDSQKEGYRLFHVVYEDGDDEWMHAESVYDILTVRKCLCV